MESKDQPKPEAPPAAKAPQKWWKSPQIVLEQIKQIPSALTKNLKQCLQWPKLIFLWVKANKLQAALVLSAGVAIVLPVFLFFMIREARHRALVGAPVKPEEIYSALESGDYAKTKILAKLLLNQKDLKQKDASLASFALGLSAVKDAEKMKGEDRLSQFLLASRFLEDSLTRGFPEQNVGEGLYLYGKSLYEIGRYAQCRPVLIKAMKADPQQKTELYSMLANAFMNDAKSDLSQAMEQNAVYLSDKSLSLAERLKGMLLKAKTQLRMDKFEDCRATLNEISETVKECPPAIVIEGRILMREAQLLHSKIAESSEGNPAQVREKYEKAIAQLRIAESLAEPGSEAVRQAMYLIGVCFMEMGDNRAAFDQLTRTRKLFKGTPEGMAAYLQEAELSRRMGREMEMVFAYRRVLGKLDKSIPYSNPWITLDELKLRLTNAFQLYQAKQMFDICMQLVILMKPLILPEQMRLMQAELCIKWGQYLEASAEKAARIKREPIRRMARAQFRRAGQHYVELARMYADRREYSDHIWSAASAYLEGHDFRRAANLFRAYLKDEVQRRHPQALECLGEALLSQGKYQSALDTLKECIDLFPRDAASCQARLLAAQASRELGDIPGAEKILLANLNGDYLTPASKEWRESLLLLGEMLHDAGRFDEAVVRLEEGVKRYSVKNQPDLLDTVQARYLLADSCRRIAMTRQDELAKDRSGSSREFQAKRIGEDFEKSLTQYQAILEQLGGNRDTAELSELEKHLLRNSYFSIADVLYAEGKYEEAVKAYYIAINRYQNRPEILDAYVQIAGAYRRLARPHDALNALHQAELLLARMKPDAPFNETSNYTRQQWSQNLMQLQEIVKRG